MRRAWRGGRTALEAWGSRMLQQRRPTVQQQAQTKHWTSSSRPASPSTQALDAWATAWASTTTSLRGAAHRASGHSSVGDRHYSILLRLPSSYCAVGLALAEQVLPADRAVPMEAYDVRLDALVVGDGRVLRR